MIGVRPKGGRCEPCSDITPNRRDMRSEFGYSEDKQKSLASLVHFAYRVGATPRDSLSSLAPLVNFAYQRVYKIPLGLCIPRGHVI